MNKSHETRNVLKYKKRCDLLKSNNPVELVARMRFHSKKRFAFGIWFVEKVSGIRLTKKALIEFQIACKKSQDAANEYLTNYERMKRTPYTYRVSLPEPAPDGGFMFSERAGFKSPVPYSNIRLAWDPEDRPDDHSYSKLLEDKADAIVLKSLKRS